MLYQLAKLCMCMLCMVCLPVSCEATSVFPTHVHLFFSHGDCCWHVTLMWCVCLQPPQVLFEYIHGDDHDNDGDNDSNDDADYQQADYVMDQSDDVITNKSGSSRLAQFKRRAALSDWLRQQAKPAVAAALAGGKNSSSKGGKRPLELVLQLLSGQQLAVAAAVAASMGDVRLSTLIATAGSHGAHQGDMTKQIQVRKAS